MEKQAIIVVDLSFGDAGKGSIVDYLVRKHEAKTVIRFNGGAQAAHNVVTPDKRHHTFSQFSSGTFVSGVKTFLSKYVLVNPIALLEEGSDLLEKGVTDAFERMLVDERALVTTPFHWAANRLKEMARGEARHGSCGKGIGETMADFLAYGEEMIRVGDLRDKELLRAKLEKHQALKRNELRPAIDKLPRNENVMREIDILEGDDVVEMAMRFYARFLRQVKVVGEDELQKILDGEKTVIFEGAQGALIDEWFGFHPFTTWSTTRDYNARELLKGYGGNIKTVGLLRAYASRHGAGPFVTEVESLSKRIPDLHNRLDDWQEHFRLGWQDVVALKYAIAINERVDELAVTCLDRFEELPDWKIAVSYALEGAMREKAARYFRLDPDTGGIVGIRLKEEIEDLDYQAAMAELLFKARPVLADPKEEPKEKFLQKTSGRMAGYLTFLENALGVPIALISTGMTANDKVYL